ncbi:MAG: glutamate--tRNA ligase [bacterium]
MSDKVRVRYAPSSTGFLHLGALRTALYNYLFARANDGVFILRIEDTDRKRVVEGSIEDIKENIEWAGLTIDEGPGIGGGYGPYIQSKRKDIYNKYANELLESGHAYKCFCTAERLEEMRKIQKLQKKAPGYDRLCRNLSKEEIEEKEKSGAPYVVRFKMPLEGETIVNDKIRGKIVINNSTLQDSVILKSDNFPTYHLAAVVDDNLMEISHVLRGEEWINSTPLHIQLYNAFGWSPPIFAHLPVILSSTGKGKMSKRDGDTMVKDYIRKGYLPQAMINFLVNLGWALDDKTEIYDLKELENIFSIEKIGKAAPRFQLDKLNHFNEYYIRKLSIDEFLENAKPFLKEDGLNPDTMTPEELEKLKSALEIIQERITLLSDTAKWIKFFFEDELQYENPQELIQKKMDKEKAINLLEELKILINNEQKLDKSTLESKIKELQEKTGIKGRPFFMTIRIAITGSKVSPPLYESIIILGKEKTLKHIQKSIDTIKSL